MTELFKEHPEYKEYQVSNLGNVYSVRTGRNLKLTRVNGKYLTVNLSIRGDRIKKYVHRLVAETFISNPNILPQVNHKDGNKLNNSISNLEWVTCSENMQHAHDTNLIIAEKGEDRHCSKLKETDIKEIRVLRELGIKVTLIAHAYEISISQVYRIINNQNWSHL